MWSKKKIALLVLFGVLITAFFGIMMAHELKDSDFPQHIEWARKYAEIGYLNKIPHTLFAKFVVIIRALLPANILVLISPLAKQVFDLKSFEISAWLLMIFCYIGTIFWLFWKFNKEWSGVEEKKKLGLIIFSVFTILLVFPIFIFTYPEQMYLGYVSPNPFHNPTYILFRPFVLLAFYSIVENLFSKWQWKKSILILVFILCGTLAKPSFTITILPAVGIMIVLFYTREIKKINWLYLIFPLGLTSLVVLLTQYIVNYSGYWGDQVVFAPFNVVMSYVSSWPLVIVFWVLSILFPLLVAIFYFREIEGKISFRLVWLNFLVAALLNLLLGEKFNLGSNNFGWGTMIAVFLLFLEAIIIFGKKLLEIKTFCSTKSLQIISLGGILLVHLVCGFIYYFDTLSGKFIW